VTDTDPHEHLSRFHQRRAEAISRVPLLKRMEQRSLWAMALLGVPTASVFIWIGPDGAWFWALLGAAFLPQLWHAGAWVRLRHRLVSSGFTLCPGCAYDQSGLPDRGHCPECGREYTHRVNVDLWIDAGLCSAREALGVDRPGDSPESEG
jgi:hypothetical protein